MIKKKIKFDGERTCHGAENLPEVDDNDFCFFKNMPVFEFEMLEAALSNNQIEVIGAPYYQGGVTRATAGRADGRRVFVRFKDMDKTKEIYEELFGESE